MTDLPLAVAAAHSEARAVRRGDGNATFNRKERLWVAAAVLLIVPLLVGLSIARPLSISNPDKETPVLTLPTVIEHPETPYVAIACTLHLPFDDVVQPVVGRLSNLLEERAIKATGPMFFKHNAIDMPVIEMEVGVPVDRVIDLGGDAVSGLLPAGRYAEITYFGAYDDLVEVNGVLICWSRGAGHVFDSEMRGNFEHFANRLEIYHTSPEEEPDPQKWQTTVSIKLRD